MRRAGLLEYGSKTLLIGVTAGDTKRELSGLPAEQKDKPVSYIFLHFDIKQRTKLHVTRLVQQHHDAVTVGVAVEMTCDDITVLPEDGNQPLVVALSYSSDVSGKGQVAHWYMGYNVHLNRKRDTF